MDRIDRPAHVMNVTVLEAANDLYDGINLANVAKKLVAQTFSLARAFDEAGDIHKLDRRRYRSGRFGHASPEHSSRGSGTDTTPWFGSIVQKG